MHTKESLLGNSALAKALSHLGQKPKGVLTTEEQNQLAAKLQNFEIITNGEVFWFTDDFLMCQGELASRFGFVGVSKPCPIYLTSRGKRPNRVISTGDLYVAMYRRSERQITTIEELVDYLNGLEK